MGRNRIILGSTKIITKGNHYIYSQKEINYSSSQKIEQIGVQDGIIWGSNIEKLEFSNPLEGFIKEAYWIDEQNKKTKLMSIKSNIIRFYIRFSSSAVGKKYSVIIKSLDPISDDNISSKSNHVVKSEHTFFKFDLSAKNFQKGGDAIQKLYFMVTIEGQGKMKFPISEKDYLKVHVIRYIPQVMRAQSPPWEIAAQCQERWFEKEKAQKPNYSDPVIDIIKMNWVFKFNRVHNVLKQITNKYWATRNSMNLFCQRLQEMYKYKEKDKYGNTIRDLKLPKIIGQSEEFGSFDNSKIRINEHGTKTTILDRYYINSVSFSSDMLNDSLDDLYGSLGNFAFRITPKGIITLLSNNVYRITYKKIAVYCVDSFDFFDSPGDAFSQPLGFWDITNNIISKTPTPASFYINNQSYRDYQRDYNQGGDYILISDYEDINIDFSFNVVHFPNHDNIFILK